MALNIWTRDLVPELAFRGAQALGASGARAGASIGAGIEKRLEESKRLNTAGKAAKTFLDALNEASGADDTTLSMHKEVTKAMSNRDAIAKMTGVLQAQGYQTAQAHFKAALLQATGAKLANEGTAALPDFGRKLAEILRGGTAGAPAAAQSDYYENPERYSAAPQPTEEQAMAAALAAHPEATMSPQFDNSTQAVLKALKSNTGAMSLMDAFNMARNPPAGFSPGAVQVNPNGTPGLAFTPTPPAQPPAVIPAGLEPRTTTIDPAGKQTTTYGITDKAKALTDAQANALQYSERMKFNNSIIDHIEQQGFSPATVTGTVQGALPNFMASEMSQQYHAAARNWISAVLRKESGAAISKSEETGALNQYFPKLGDAPSVIKQKADLRKLAEENMRRAIGSIDEAGKAAPATDAKALATQARAAIKAGKDAAAVKARYKELTGKDLE
jgi:hypothetical protein